MNSKCTKYLEEILGIPEMFISCFPPVINRWMPHNYLIIKGPINPTFLLMPCYSPVISPVMILLLSCYFLQFLYLNFLFLLQNKIKKEIVILRNEVSLPEEMFRFTKHDKVMIHHAERIALARLINEMIAAIINTSPAKKIHQLKYVGT